MKKKKQRKKRTLPPDESLTKVEINSSYVSEKTARNPLATETSNKQSLSSTTTLKTKVLGFGKGKKKVFNYFVS